MAGAGSYFCCIYIIDGSPGDRLCAELWELCALFCQKKRQVGAQQDSSNTPTGRRRSPTWSARSIVSLIFVIFFGAAFFHVGVHAGTDEGKIQSAHVQWCVDPQGKDIPAQRSRIC